MRAILVFALSTAMTITAAGTAAAQKGKGQGAKVKTTAPSQGAKAQGGGKAAGGPKATGGTKTTGGPKITRGGKTPAAGGGAKKSGGAAATSGKRDATSTTTTTTTLTPVQQKLQRNTNLASKLEGRLPAGTDLMNAAEGFRNLGQFVAAVNVSNNLGLSFTDLKARMVDDGMSLGQAIKELRPSVDSTTEVRRAESEATRLIGTTEESSGTTTKTTKKGKGRG